MGNPVWSDREVQSLEPLGPKHGRCTASKESSKWVPCDESYFMAGGFNSVSPQADDLVNYPDSTAYVVPNVKGYHVEYGKVHDLKILHDEGNCHLIGSASAAAYWCAATGSDQELLFGKRPYNHFLLISNAVIRLCLLPSIFTTKQHLLE